MVSWRGIAEALLGISPLERGAGEGESPVLDSRNQAVSIVTAALRRVGLLGNAALSGW